MCTQAVGTEAVVMVHEDVNGEVADFRRESWPTGKIYFDRLKCVLQYQCTMGGEHLGVSIYSFGLTVTSCGNHRLQVRVSRTGERRHPNGQHFKGA